MGKKCVSLRELFDNGIQYLEYDGKIVCTDEGGLCHYDLYKDDDIEYGLLLCLNLESGRIMRNLLLVHPNMENKYILARQNMTLPYLNSQ